MPETAKVIHIGTFGKPSTLYEPERIETVTKASAFRGFLAWTCLVLGGWVCVVSVLLFCGLAAYGLLTLIFG